MGLPFLLGLYKEKDLSTYCGLFCVLLFSLSSHKGRIFVHQIFAILQRRWIVRVLIIWLQQSLCFKAEYTMKSIVQCSIWSDHSDIKHPLNIEHHHWPNSSFFLNRMTCTDSNEPALAAWAFEQLHKYSCLRVSPSPHTVYVNETRKSLIGYHDIFRF